MTPKTKVRSHTRNIEFSGHNFEYKEEGNQFRVGLGNMTDAGWYWSGKKDDLAGYLWRIGHSSTTDEFIQQAEENRLYYQNIKADALRAIDKGDALYEASGDNVRWHFGENSAADEIDEYVDGYDEDKLTDEQKKKLIDAAYNECDGDTFEEFEKSSQGKQLKQLLKKIYSGTDSFKGLFRDMKSEDTFYDINDITSEFKSNVTMEAIGKAKKKLGY